VLKTRSESGETLLGQVSVRAGGVLKDWIDAGTLRVGR
jgi:hypothetical protein